MSKKIRMGMIGGSLDGFIGSVHRMAAALDGTIELVCGAFSSNAKRSIETGNALDLPEDRIYVSFEEMIAKEAQLPADLRMQFVSIVTPNHLHAQPAALALKHGFHVLCEKPLAFSFEEAKKIGEHVKRTGLLFGVTHTYTGYPMVKEAKDLIAKGKLGKIRKVIVEYPQGWLSDPIENDGQKQASWRTNPAQAGISCCVGDIGTHAENLVEYITDLKITELSADVSSVVAGRTLDDDANVLLRFNNGAKGILIASQIANGEENELKIRVYGEHGGLKWLQSEPNTLIVKQNDQPTQLRRAGANHSYLSEHARLHCRIPAGHPEGYIEAMANLYRNFAASIHAFENKTSSNPLLDYPTIEDGIRGMQFIETVIASGKENAAWKQL
ncbi:Gfo/Idh/MocA family protein [Cytophaga aurantiaca]|uniref:Gfo/Idh/MocA family protein n=1 Tax=Cytophaga aurantiaca TaxID=29530 RepID=UPI0003807ED0|nr:Gfo/Idh/MocA family oxidoreductase [Cytophaga aurantiaca]